MTQYISLNTYNNTFHLGVYDTLEEAKSAYILYLESHDNFSLWWNKTIKEYENEFGKIPSDLFSVLSFDDNHPQYDDMECFWDERSVHINLDNIHESVHSDFNFVADYSGWVVGSDGKSSLETLINTLYYCRINNPDIKWLAKTYPTLTVDL